MKKHEYLRNTLELALGLKRPHAGKSVKILTDYLLKTLPRSYMDQFGNVHCVVGEGSRTLFSSHTDTVHREDGVNSYIKSIETPIGPKHSNAPTERYRALGAVLGADCGAGVAIMTHMIMNKLPGHYVFHHAEEVGGIGSSALAETNVFKDKFDRAVAFDRKATYSIITHQSSGQCCTNLFAEALADQLNQADNDFMYYSDDTGVYTDTAEYVDLIPECTNLSVGYYNEHTQNESLDFTFLVRLSKAVLKVKWEELPIGVKDPIVPRVVSGSGLWPHQQWGSPATEAFTAEEELDEMLSAYQGDDYDFTEDYASEFVKKFGNTVTWGLLDAAYEGLIDSEKHFVNIVIGHSPVPEFILKDALAKLKEAREEEELPL